MHTDPLALFFAAVDAINRQDWRAVAQLCDIASLSEFKNELIAMLRRPTPESSFKAIDFMSLNPSMPRAVAEWQAQQVREHHDPDRRLREEVPNLTSLAAMIRRQSDGGWLFVASRDLLMIDPIAAYRTEFAPKSDVDEGER